MRLFSRVVLVLLAVQGVGTGFLWTLDPTGRGAQATFATFLGIDLVGFALISYLYRMDKGREVPSRSWLTLGLCTIAALLVTSLFTA